MQRESVRRGFSVSNQKVALEIDFAGALQGFTELTIVANNPDLRTISLHSRQCKILGVKVNTHTADFVHYDPLAHVTINKPDEFNSYPELKRKIYSALSESDEGELSIAIPSQVSVIAPAPTQNGPSTSTNASNAPEYLPLVVRIEYSLKNPVDGLQFVLPSDAYPFRVPHMYTSPSSPDAARCWVPCVDNLWERCTWEFEFVVPRSLDADGDSLTGPNYNVIVVCSGEFQQQIIHPLDPDKVIFLFEQQALTSVQHICFVAGPFHVMPLAATPAATGNRLDSTIDVSAVGQPRMHAFCLPGHERHLVTTANFLPQAMRHFIQEVGSYPFSSFKLVFVDDLIAQRHDGATMCLASIDLLHTEDAIDPVFETRLILSQAVAVQWFGINIYQKTWSDSWLVSGLASYITASFIRKHFGNNEYRFRLKKDILRVVDLDVGEMPPICQPGLLEPSDATHRQFINLKAPLVLHILDRRMHKTGTSQGLHRIIPKIILDALENENAAAISTHTFLRMCRKTAGLDFRPFAEQWVYGSGCPRFTVRSHFNRKKMAVEMHVKQDSPAFEANKDDPISQALLRPMPFFDGQMTIRIHEADGTPYEHVLDIRQPYKKFEVPFNTKYKRVRRNTKRFIARQAAAEAAANPETAELIGVVDMSFGLGIWEDDASREEWKVADWTETDEAHMATATYEWIRLDTDIEWLTKITFDQEPFMWVSQLQRDRDVIAQIEAIHALSRIPSKIVSSTLTKTVLTTTYFFRVRSEAALSLVPCAGAVVDFLGLYHLYKLFFRYCYEPQNREDLFKNELVPKPNDFSDFSEYFLRKALITALSQVRLENGETLPIVRRFLIDQLKYNDNSTNNFSDAYYVAHLIGALGCALVSTTPPERAELQGDHVPQVVEDPRLKINKDILDAAVAEVDRYRDMDRVIPSWRNSITVSTLEFNLMLMMANCIPNNPIFFLLYTREGNSTPVRISAFDGLFMMKWYQPEVIKYIIAVICRDSSLLVSRHVASSMCESLAIQFAIGEIKMPAKEPEPILIEEDATKPEVAKEPKKSELDLMIKTLRKDKEIGRNATLRKNLMVMMLNPSLDHEVRWSMLKLSDLVFRAVEEPLPKLTIHLPPPTPVAVEPPPPSKKLKLSLSIGGISSGAPSPRVTADVAADADVRLPPETPSYTSKLILKPPKEPKTPAAPASVPAPAPVPVPTATPLVKVKYTAPWAKSGLTLQEKKMIDLIMKRVNPHPSAIWFLHPVDPIRHGAPTYFDIVKNPMDLSTIAANLKSGLYGSIQDFANDFNLMLSNAYLFNPPGTQPHQDAQKVEELFKKLWKTTDDAVQKDKAKVKPPAPPIVVPTEDNIDDELLEAADGTGDAEGEEDAPFDEDMDELLLGSAPVASSPAPAKIKIKSIRRPVPDMDDLDAVLYDAADASSTNERTGSSKPTGDSGVSLPRPKLKVSFGGPSRASAPTVESVPERTPEVRPTPPIKRETSVSTVIAPPPEPPSGSRKRAINHGDMEDGSEYPVDAAKCKALIQKLTEQQYGWIFALPVDSTQPGLESYYEEIKHPMDYQTITKNLDRKKYANMEEFADDLRLVYANGRKFNAASPDIITLIDSLEGMLRKEWPGMLRRKLPTEAKRNLAQALTQLKAEDVNMIFHFPVDPIALNIPHYFDVIPKENARDLATIKSKLDKGLYQTPDQVNQDVMIMFGNAHKFNGRDSPISNIAAALEGVWTRLYNKARVIGGDGHVNKKPRYG